ncbi:Pkinase-domain-containing protein [Rhizoclosmatium globosum]|uniref:Serine/threonine-protein kinase n=1 Tax=Rhizoclosmatium globosum TaxID=329046 RepID=A0A1Y2B7L9_9FUNG|nr:Pkinase-domain-containing protein [Rhizoclosmatium globosum]|eukprot:ORY30724.1 Pkinase-domain-containing protein [Rhizoclosmatium globosum]
MEQVKPPVSAAQPPPPTSSSKHAGPPPPQLIIDKKANASYATGKLLGEGGFARCFEVSTEKGERLAAKVIRKASLTSQKQKQKLFAEIRIHQQMSHPAIVQFQHVFEDDDNVYMIMELCENGTMVDMLRTRKRLSEPEVRYYMHHLLHGVNYMHQHRVIHRDLKLGNMFLAKDMRLKIGDFGLAAILKHDGERKKTICGTPNYIAPEVLFDTSTGHSYEVDMWSLGVVLYTLLIGKPPFQTKDVKQIYKKIRDNTYEFPNNVPISDAAREVVEALLTRDPNSRPTVQEVLGYTFFVAEPVPYLIPTSALHTIPTLAELNIVVRNNQPSSNGKLSRSNTTANTTTGAAGGLIGQPKPSSPRAPVIPTYEIPPLPKRTTSEPITHTSLDSPAKRIEAEPVPPLTERQRASRGISAEVEPFVKSMSALVMTATHRSQDENVENENRGSRGSGVQRLRSSGHEGVLGESTTLNQASPRTLRHSVQTHNYSHEKETRAVGKDPVSIPQQQPSTMTASPLQQTRRSLTRNDADIPATSTPTTQPQPTLMRPPTPNLNRQVEQTTTTPRSTLENMYRTIKTAISNINSQTYHPATDEDESPHPDVFIIKWIDYSNKYGLGYELQDGSIGVYFNDSTSLLMSSDQVHIEYLYYESGAEGTRMHRRPYTMTTYPTDLQKKVTLLKHFAGYMQEKLYQNVKEDIHTSPRTSDLIFLTKYLKTKHGVVFRLSNQIVQINLFDHTKLILSQNAQLITYIDKNREMTTRTVESFLARKEREVVDRIVYAKDILEQMILKKQKKASGGGGGGDAAV